VLSGGVIGGQRLAEQLGHRNVITTDVGGTTFLAGLIVDGEPVMAPGSIVNQFPINAATIRVHTIGSGGGALASVDAGGNLRLGPQSAEAVPGPACYGNGGTRPTNTDANLVLGILSERGLLGGRKPLSKELAREAIRVHVADPLGLTVDEAAIAIHEVQNAQAGDLLRRAVVQAGYDPRDFVAYAFGGAGPAHCAGYCRDLGVAEVVVPLGPVASAFSAYGLAASDVALSAELSDPSSFPVDHGVLAAHFDRLEADLQRSLDRQKVKFHDVTLQREIDLRYSMQVNELAVTLPDTEITERSGDEIVERFEEQYERINGSGAGFREAGVQAITYRMRAKAGWASPSSCRTSPTPTARTPPRRCSRSARSASTRRSVSWTPPCTATPGCVRATSWWGPRSSTCRPPWSSSRPASPAWWTGSATSYCVTSDHGLPVRTAP